jgi:hypothetical protein
MSRPLYTEVTLTRALDHHVGTGAVQSYTRHPERRGHWLVELPRFGRVTFTTAELSGLTHGLAAGERRWKDVPAD